MKLKLHSDFDDYYDGGFEQEGVAFDRFSEDGPSRREMYALLEQAGYRVPRHGTVEELAARITREWQQMDVPVSASVIRQMTDLVVYATARSHGGDIHLVSIDEALRFFPHHYCTELIRVQSGERGWMLQYLQIGDRCWWLNYASSNNWRSNVGDCQIEVIEEGPRGYHAFFKEPIFSIDFLPAQELYAIDYNVGLKLAGTGIEALLPAAEVVDLIGAALRHKESFETRCPSTA